MTVPAPSRLPELGAFLRAHRERLSPEDAGLPPRRQRRRTPGLRREEVADLAGISAVWYVRIEQGRGVSASPEALGRLATVLRLGRAARAHLFDLAGRRDPEALAAAPGETVPAALSKAVEASLAPAYVIDHLWNARAFNALAERLFAAWLGPARPDAMPGGAANLLAYVFLDPSARSFIVGWEDRARRLLAEFRADFGRRPTDADMAALIGRLWSAEPLFARWWDEAHVLGREGGLRLFDHPDDGRLAFDQITLVPAEMADFKLVMLLPPSL